MHPRSLHSLCLQGLFLVAAAGSIAGAEQAPGPSAQSVPTFATEGLGKGTVAIDGPWQFHLGDDLAWADPAFDDSHWEQLTADKPWGAQGHPNDGGFAWYRRHVAVNPAPGAGPDLALFVLYVQDAYEIYWNGRLVGGRGKLPPHAVILWYPTWQTFGLGQAHEGVLAVRVWHAPPQTEATPEGGGFLIPPVLGSPDAIARYEDEFDYGYMRSHQFNFGLAYLYSLAGLLSFLAWMRDRRQSLLIWMAGFCFAQPLRLLPPNWPSPISLATSNIIYCLLQAIQDVSLWFLLLLLLRLDERLALARWVRRLAWLQLAFFAADAVAVIPIATGRTRWVVPSQVADYTLTICYSLLETLPLVLVVCAVVRRRRLDPARWLVAVLAFTTEMIPAMILAVGQGRQYTHLNLMQMLSAPLFTVRGSPIDAGTLSGSLLLLAVIYAVYHYTVEERRRQTALEQEFKSARELQQMLIPETLPSVGGFTLTSAYKPASEVGGDFFQIIPLEDDTTLIVLGDVSGKGLKAAMSVSFIVGVVRALANIIRTPEGMLSELNSRLCGRLQGGFTTCVALRLGSDGRATIATAGHPAPFLNDKELDLPAALPLGLFATAAYEETTLHLKASDHLALYTDGLLEARSPSGELYSFDRLKSLFAAKPTAEQAATAAVTFGQDDDITVLTLTRHGVGEVSTSQITAPILSPL
jgi:hypothetical protein